MNKDEIIKILSLIFNLSDVKTIKYIDGTDTFFVCDESGLDDLVIRVTSDSISFFRHDNIESLTFDEFEQVSNDPDAHIRYMNPRPGSYSVVSQALFTCFVSTLNPGFQFPLFTWYYIFNKLMLGQDPYTEELLDIMREYEVYNDSVLDGSLEYFVHTILPNYVKTESV